MADISAPPTVNGDNGPPYAPSSIGPASAGIDQKTFESYPLTNPTTAAILPPGYPDTPLAAQIRTNPVGTESIKPSIGWSASGLPPESMRNYPLTGQKDGSGGDGGFAQFNRPAPQIGVDENGVPIYDESTAEGAAANRTTTDASMRMAEKAGEGASFGTLPLIVAGARTLAGTPFQQGLEEQRQYSADTTKMAPGASLIAEGAGGAATSLLPFGAAAKAEQALADLIPWAAPTVVRWLGHEAVQSATGAGVASASTAGHDVGSGNTENIGSDVLHSAGWGGLLGAAAEPIASIVQAVPNMAKSLWGGVRVLLTDAGKDAVAGQVVRESTASDALKANPNDPANYQTTPLAQPPAGPVQPGQPPLQPALTLRTAQATGDPGLIGLERQMKPADVEGGKTSDQVNTVVRNLVGDDAGTEPSVLAARASTNGVKAVNDLDTALSKTETDKWENAPAMKAVRLNGPGIADGVTQDVSQLPASFRDAITGPQGKLGSFLQELQELGPNATIADVNSVVSRLRRVGRDAGSGATPDSVTATAANKMADSIIDKIGADPAIAGAPARTVPQSNSVAGSGLPNAQTTTIPAMPPNPQALAEFQAARDFTRQYHQTMGFREFDGILNANKAGNVQGDPTKMFGQFYNAADGSGTGLLRLQDAARFARANGATAEADALENAANDYVNAEIVRQGRMGGGAVDMQGRPAMSMATLHSTVDKSADALKLPIMQNSKGDIEAAGDAAGVLNRPSALKGAPVNSDTLKQLQHNDLMSVVMGQAGAGGAGALAGGYIMARHGPDNVPWYIRVPVGMALGTVGGGVVGGMAGRMMASVPGVSEFVGGPTKEIISRVEAGLANEEDYRRLMSMPIFKQSGLFSRGPMNSPAETAVKASIPETTQGAKTNPLPSINPKTGLPQFNLSDAQIEKAEQIIHDIAGLDPPRLTAWVDQHKAELRKAYGGQGVNRVMQIASLMRRVKGDKRDPATLFSVIASGKNSTIDAALKAAQIDLHGLAARAILDADLAKVLATKTTRDNLTKAGEHQIVTALR